MARIAAAALLLSSALALGQTPPVQEINIDEEELVRGDLLQPDVETVRGEIRPEFGTLIRVRTEFSEKVMNSATELP